MIRILFCSLIWFAMSGLLLWTLPAAHADPIVLPRFNPWHTDPVYSELRMDVVTAHTPWAKPYAGRPMRVVAIAPRWTQRDSVELMQRFDFSITPIMTLRSHTWGDENAPHYAWIAYGTKALVTERALDALADGPDVIVLGWLNTSIIPAEVEQKIFDAVAGGAGLVVFNPKVLSEKLQAVIAESRLVEPAVGYRLVDGFASRQLPPLMTEARPLVGEGVRLYETPSLGRIAVVDYGRPLVPYPQVGSWSSSYLTPPLIDSDATRDFHHDYYTSFAGRCILWAGKNMPQVAMTGWTELSNALVVENNGITLGRLQVVDAPAGAVVELTIRDDGGVVEQRVTTPVGTHGFIDLSSGPIKSGDHFADVILRRADGHVLDWGTHAFTTSTSVQIVSIDVPNQAVVDRRSVAIRVTNAGEVDGKELVVEATDTHGRLVWSDTRSAAMDVSFEMDLSGALASHCEVRVMLRGDGRVLAESRADVLLQAVHPHVDEFEFGGWASTSRDFVMRQAAGVMVDHGLSGGIVVGDMDAWARMNVHPIAYITRYYPKNPPGRGLMERMPCLTDPEFLAQEKDKLTKAVLEKKRYSPAGYTLGDDQGMMLTYQDACISQTCLAAFGQYLAKRYETIAALNEAWGTGYTAFDEVMPLSYDDALSDGHYPRWADHRMYMDKLFVDTHEWARDVVREVDPGAHVGFEGPLKDDSWYGYAWKAILERMDLMAVYPNPWKFDIVRSFKPAHMNFGAWYGGYPMYQNEYDLRSYPWFMLFNGCNNYLFFRMYGGSEAGHPAEGIGPDLRPARSLTVTTQQVHRIQRGIDRLVLGATYQDGGVAVMHSRSSVHATTVTPDIPMRDFKTDPAWSEYLAEPNSKWALNTEAALRLLDDLGLPFVMVDRTDVAAGALEKRGVRMLVLPMVLSLSDAESRAIRDFVKSGGIVVTDVRPGVFDEHIQWRSTGALDDVLGIKRNDVVNAPLVEQWIDVAQGEQRLVKRDSGAMMPEMAGQDVVVEQRSGVGLPMPVDATVSVDDGQAMASTDAGVPVFIANEFGRGQTLLLNMALQHYVTLRAAGQGGALREMINPWLEQAGLPREIRLDAVGDHDARARLFPYTRGSMRLIGLLRPHKRLADETDAFVDLMPRPFVLHVGKPGHVYDIINRTYLGYRDSLDLSIEPAMPYVFAVLPYRVTGVHGDVTVVGVDEKASQPLRGITLNAAVQASSESITGEHVIHVQVTDAQGRHRPEYDVDILATDGKATHAITLGFNDPSGVWTFELEDVATGTTSEVTGIVPSIDGESK